MQCYFAALCPHLISEAKGRCCQDGGYHKALNPFLPLLSFQPSSPTLTPLNPDGSPALGRSLQASTCQGVPVQSSRRDTGMCTKAVTAFCCCQRWRLSPPQRSQLAHCRSLIFLCYWMTFVSTTFSRLWVETWDSLKAWQGLWIRESKAFIIPKVGAWCTWLPTTILDKSLATV